MKRLAYFVFGSIALRLLEYILVILAEQETQYLYEFTAEGAFLCPAGKQYEWN
jgi:hypothetical protein